MIPELKPLVNDYLVNENQGTKNPQTINLLLTHPVDLQNGH